MEMDSRVVLSGLKEGEAGPLRSVKMELQRHRTERFWRLAIQSTDTLSKPPIYSGQFYFCKAFKDMLSFCVNVWMCTGLCMHTENRRGPGSLSDVVTGNYETSGLLHRCWDLNSDPHGCTPSHVCSSCLCTSQPQKFNMLMPIYHTCNNVTERYAFSLPYHHRLSTDAHISHKSVINRHSSAS